MIARIAVSTVNFAADKSYSYRVPQDMTLSPGSRVVIPFGRGNRLVEGIVLGVESGCEDKLKAVARCLDGTPLLTEQMLRLAAFMRERYFCIFYDAARVMLPREYWFSRESTVTLTGQTDGEAEGDLGVLIDSLRSGGGSRKESVLRGLFDTEEQYRRALQEAKNQKLVQVDADFKPRGGSKTEEVAALSASAEETMAYAEGLPRSAGMQKEVLRFLCAVGSASVKEICYYTGASVRTVRRLGELGYLTLTCQQVLRIQSCAPKEITAPLVLSDEQQAAFAGLCGRMEEENPGAALLYGVTGSGKTSVYLKLIEEALKKGKSAIYLVPEIALTPQLLSLLTGWFGQKVAVIHSSLTPGQRYDSWMKIHSGDAKVIVGTRSAVFVPAVDLGLVIVDEEQEHSYVSEASPRYDAREIALWRGSREKALVLFGSATPSVETMYRAKQGMYGLYTLKNRYNGQSLPRVEIVDMLGEQQVGNDSALSLRLQQLVKATAAEGKQSILFLNRRGNSQALVCVSCRKSPECPRCNARLTYHSANNRLMCHRCGFSRTTPERCPECGGHLKQLGCGTQKVQQELETAMPGMPTLRMDTDTVSAVNTHERILDTFQKDKIPVLIGTQMVAKGLNLPNVTLVGVLNADNGLYADSFRASETTFNMLTQVVGRAGRGEEPGTAIIQTLVPEHRVITLAAKQDYDAFYETEIRLRKAANCPPFGDVAIIIFSGENETSVLRGAAKFRDSLDACLELPEYREKPCTVLGPAPCPVPKINYHFRYRLTLNGEFDKEVRRLVAHLLRQFYADKGNRGVSVFVDCGGFTE